MCFFPETPEFEYESFVNFQPKIDEIKREPIGEYNETKPGKEEFSHITAYNQELQGTDENLSEENEVFFIQYLEIIYSRICMAKTRPP